MNKHAAATISAAVAPTSGSKPRGGGASKGASKKKASPSAPGSSSAIHPKYSDMIRRALTDLKQRGGTSRKALLRYIVENFEVGQDEKVVNTHLKLALRAGVRNATIKQTKGVGAAGSFRLGDAAAPKTGKKKEKSASANVTTTKVKKAIDAKKASVGKGKEKTAFIASAETNRAAPKRPGSAVVAAPAGERKKSVVSTKKSAATAKQVGKVPKTKKLPPAAASSVRSTSGLAPKGGAATGGKKKVAKTFSGRQPSSAAAKKK